MTVALVPVFMSHCEVSNSIMVCAAYGSAKSRVLSGAQVKKLLAHRRPFLFIDHAVENDIGKSIVGVMKAGQNSQSLPSRSVVLEAMGQAGALVVRQVSPISR